MASQNHDVHCGLFRSAPCDCTAQWTRFGPDFRYHHTECSIWRGEDCGCRQKKEAGEALLVAQMWAAAAFVAVGVAGGIAYLGMGLASLFR